MQLFPNSVVRYCNFGFLAFLGLLGFLTRQPSIKFIAALLSAAKQTGTGKEGLVQASETTESSLWKNQSSGAQEPTI